MNSERHIRTPILLTVGFAILAFVVACVMVMLVQQQRAGTWVRHTLDVENRLNFIQTLVSDGETGQRGYLLTGRADYLRPYQAAAVATDHELDQLVAQTADNPAQLRRARSLRGLVQRKFAELQRTIDLRAENRGDEALSIVNSDAGIRVMADIRRTIGTMRDSESLLLAERRAASTAYISWAESLLVAGVVLTVVIGFLTLRDARIRIRTLAVVNARLVKESAERRAAEGKLQQMQKMEAVGQLTGGIAHDFNNMLAIVIGSLDLARRRLTGNEHPSLAKSIGNAYDGAERAAVLTARLLAFSRQQPLDPRVVDANKLVGSISELLRRTIGESVQIETVLAGGLWPTHADPAQIENTIVNLAVNARDAMPEGGKLTIETGNADLDDRYARAHAEVQPGQYVLISVTDTGSGMAPDVIERAFDPFYTTKGVGKGTGLGLSQVFGFVKQSGGHIKIYSEVGRGTTIKLYLPRYLGEARAAAAAGGRQPDIPHGSAAEIVLVVEDEESVRRMSLEALKELGYSVVEAATPTEALRTLADMPDVALMFTDVVMPEMSGRQLVDKALLLRPDLRVIYTTGYTSNAVVHGGVLDPGTAFIAKPFTVEQLAYKLREVLDDEAPA